MNGKYNIMNILLNRRKNLRTTNKYSLTFDGDDYIEIANDNESNFDFNYNTAFSISPWIKTSSTANQGIFGKSLIGSPWTAYTFFLANPGGSPGHLYFQMVHQYSSPANKIDVRTDSVTVNDGNWHHVVVTKGTSTDVSAVTIYNNATSSDLTTNSGGNTLDDSTLNDESPFIAAVDKRVKAGTGGYPFVGNIDEVAVFNTVLDSGAVSSIYNNGTPTDLRSNKNSYKSSDNLIGYWRFGEGSGTAATDLVGNNNGTITGATWSNSVPAR